MADISELKQIPNLAQELNDRFGVPPKEVENLLYILKIRVIAKDRGIESISNLDGEIIIQLFAGMQLDKKKLARFYRDGVKLGNSQLRMSLRQPGKGWRTMLEEIINAMG
jgi:transcription-repair coupling factor (superfamily II helicase)